MTLVFLKSIDQLFFKICLTWTCLMFSHDGNDVMYFGKSASELVLCAVYQRVHDVSTLVGLVPASLLYHKVTIFPDYEKFSFFSDICCLILEPISGSCLQQLLLICLPNGYFLFHFFLLLLLTEILLQRRDPLSVPFTCLFIYISMDL